MADNIILAAKLLEDTNSKVVWTSPSTTTKLKTILFVNTTSAQIKVDTYYTRGEESVSKKKVFTNYETPIEANDSIMISFDDDGYPMNVKNDKFWVKCDTANALMVNVSGVQ